MIYYYKKPDIESEDFRNYKLKSGDSNREPETSTANSSNYDQYADKDLPNVSTSKDPSTSQKSIETASKTNMHEIFFEPTTYNQQTYNTEEKTKSNISKEIIRDDDDFIPTKSILLPKLSHKIYLLSQRDNFRRSLTIMIHIEKEKRKTSSKF